MATKGKCEKCGFPHPKCKAHNRKKLPCGKDPVDGFAVCYMHGGATPVGPASPHYRGKDRSRHLPKGLVREYEEALLDPEWASLRNDIGLIEMRLRSLMGNLSSGESGKLWARLVEAWGETEAAYVNGDPEAMATGMTAVGEMIRTGASDQERWRELYHIIDQRKGLVESERRKAVEAQRIVTDGQVATLIAFFVEQARLYVRDPADLRAYCSAIAAVSVGSLPSP